MIKHQKNKIFTNFMLLAPLCVFFIFFIFILYQSDRTISPSPSEIYFEDKIFKNNFSHNSKKKKIVIFWSSWCTDCHKEWKTLHLISSEKKFELIGINVKDHLKDAQNFLQNAGNPFLYNFIDRKGNLIFKHGFIGLPALLVLDKDNNVEYRYNGPLNLDLYKREILELTKKNVEKNLNNFSTSI